MIARAVILSTAILAVGLYGARASARETVPVRRAFAAFPQTLGEWSGRDTTLNRDVIGQLGVDDYVNRTYLNAAAQPIGLYIGYYGSQRQGDTIHSPQNCLPGAGWQPVEGGRTTLQIGRDRVTVNRYIIEKGLDRQVVLYWYQGRGRIVANEYANKFWLMVDAARLHRSNGALVRVIAPAARSATGSPAVLAAADAAAVDFTRVLFPRLSEFLP